MDSIPFPEQTETLGPAKGVENCLELTNEEWDAIKKIIEEADKVNGFTAGDGGSFAVKTGCLEYGRLRVKLEPVFHKAAIKG